MEIITEKKIIKRGEAGWIPSYGDLKKLGNDSNLISRGLDSTWMARDFYKGRESEPLDLSTVISFILSKMDMYNNGKYVFIIKDDPIKIRKKINDWPVIIWKLDDYIQNYLSKTDISLPSIKLSNAGSSPVIKYSEHENVLNKVAEADEKIAAEKELVKNAFETTPTAETLKDLDVIDGDKTKTQVYIKPSVYIDYVKNQADQGIYRSYMVPWNYILIKNNPSESDQEALESGNYIGRKGNSSYREEILKTYPTIKADWMTWTKEPTFSADWMNWRSWIKGSPSEISAEIDYTKTYKKGQKSDIIAAIQKLIYDKVNESGVDQVIDSVEFKTFIRKSRKPDGSWDGDFGNGTGDLVIFLKPLFDINDTTSNITPEFLAKFKTANENIHENVLLINFLLEQLKFNLENLEQAKKNVKDARQKRSNSAKQTTVKKSRDDREWSYLEKGIDTLQTKYGDKLVVNKYDKGMKLQYLGTSKYKDLKNTEVKIYKTTGSKPKTVEYMLVNGEWATLGTWFMGGGNSISDIIRVKKTDGTEVKLLPKIISYFTAAVNLVKFGVDSKYAHQPWLGNQFAKLKAVNLLRSIM
jgi:hypothetical protein